MTQTDFEAIVQTIDRLTAQEKLALIEHLARSLQTGSAGASPDQQCAALQRLRGELAALPVVNPADGFSNRQHDRLLYGAP
jgi:hypothetical protein